MSCQAGPPPLVATASTCLLALVDCVVCMLNLDPSTWSFLVRKDMEFRLSRLLFVFSCNDGTPSLACFIPTRKSILYFASYFFEIWRIDFAVGYNVNYFVNQSTQFMVLKCEMFIVTNSIDLSEWFVSFVTVLFSVWFWQASFRLATTSCFGWRLFAIVPGCFWSRNGWLCLT